MGIFKKDPPQPRVPQTISARKWGRLKDSLPFPVEPGGNADPSLGRRIRFGHQRQQRRWS